MLTILLNTERKRNTLMEIHLETHKNKPNII